MLSRIPCICRKGYDKRAQGRDREKPSLASAIWWRVFVGTTAVFHVVRALAARIRIAPGDRAGAEVAIVADGDLQLLLDDVAAVPIPHGINLDLQKLPVA